MEPRTTPKPIVVLSQCLEQEACRYNAQMVRDDFVHEIGPFVEFVATCPEVEIGLGVPRDPIRLVRIGESPRLIQPTTGRDLTAAMQVYATRFLGELGAVDGFILKNRSPSCGIEDMKVYAEPGNSPSAGTRPGVFARAVLERYGDVAVEDEGRLRNPRIRHHFLSRLFTLARFRQAWRSALGGGSESTAGHAGHAAGDDGAAAGPSSRPGSTATSAAGSSRDDSKSTSATAVRQGESKSAAALNRGESNSASAAAMNRGESNSASAAAMNRGESNSASAATSRQAESDPASRGRRDGGHGRPTIAPLVEFHAAHQLLFMAHNQTALRELGRVVANAERRGTADVFAGYRAGLGRLMAQPARTGAWVNVAEHAFGYFSGELSDRERKFFAGLLSGYRADRQPLQAVLSVLGGWVARFDTKYLAGQTFFEPYPPELLALEHR